MSQILNYLSTARVGNPNISGKVECEDSSRCYLSRAYNFAVRLRMLSRA